jgi:hypothetical protein
MSVCAEQLCIFINSITSDENNSSIQLNATNKNIVNDAHQKDKNDSSEYSRDIDTRHSLLKSTKSSYQISTNHRPLAQSD